jgi:hypothetical protein
MKPAFTAAAIAAATAISSSAFAQSPAAASQFLRTQTAFDIVVHLPYAEAAPLFGPEANAPGLANIGTQNFSIPSQPTTNKALSSPFITAPSPQSGSTRFSISKRVTSSTSTSSPTSWSQQSTCGSRPPIQTLPRFTSSTPAPRSPPKAMITSPPSPPPTNPPPTTGNNPSTATSPLASRRAVTPNQRDVVIPSDQRESRNPQLLFLARPKPACPSLPGDPSLRSGKVQAQSSIHPRHSLAE